MKYYLIAGERSGDLHAANLMAELKRLDPNAQFRGMGGDYMIGQGLQLAAHYDAVAVMGFLEVVLGFRKVMKQLSLVKRDLVAFAPDAVVLVDFAGFNMRIARFARAYGFPVHYYIVPKVWAWNQKRALTLKKYCHRLYAILPFEPAFFERFGLEVPYVGNPLRDELEKFVPDRSFLTTHNLGGKPIVALLPGSRKQEVVAMLDTMIGLVREHRQWDFVIAGVRNLPAEVYAQAREEGIMVVFDQTYDLLSAAHGAVVTSGTATLETALFNVPQVVVYRTSTFTYALAKNLMKVPYISLVNLIADKEVVRELIQHEYTRQHLGSELKMLMEEGEGREQILKGYTLIQGKLGTKKASRETARLIYQELA
ncbi:Lipid-A-disaccharide synthase [Lunatimonas lonarensis]|uniref:Lipid-A-disaccharide synthase n=1 Tax=Lunatimonas lonarensis TaxID=1232681 RepID=R7ZYD3_9BACT|nr:lipid-A-disaccharide synthase [Lunatimonas lonarensis]EON79096.1 Lipid-A-disaccharide synthase [Lunatimonas lonarensis]